MQISLWDMMLLQMTSLMSLKATGKYHQSINQLYLPSNLQSRTQVLLSSSQKLTIDPNQVKCWFLRRGETRLPGENLWVQSREPTNSTHMTPDLEIAPGPHWWEASALTTGPSLHPVYHTHIIKFYIVILSASWIAGRIIIIVIFSSIWVVRNPKSLNLIG